MLVVRQCPVCQGSGDRYTDRGEYKIFRCTNCTLLYTGPVPDAEELEILYRNEWSVPAGQTYSHRSKPTRAWRLGWQARKLRRLVSGDSLLEIGCGPGDLLRGARMAGFTSIAGVEPGDGEAEYARSLGFEVHNQMVLDVEFTDARFDIIVSRQVIEHVLDPVRFLTTATALLRPRAAASCWKHPAAVISKRAARARTGATCGPRGILTCSMKKASRLCSKNAAWNRCRSAGTSARPISPPWLGWHRHDANLMVSTDNLEIST